MIAVYHAEPDEAQADAAVVALLARGRAASPFDRLDWLRLLAREGMAPRQSRLAVAREDEAIAVLPFARAADGLGPLANWYSFTTGPITNDPAKAPRLLAALAASLVPDGALDLWPVAPREAALLLAALRSTGWAALAAPCDHNHRLRLGGRSFADYWATRPGSLRSTVRRKGRSGTVAIRLADRFDPADWAAYEQVYRASWKPAEGAPDLLRAFARDEGAAGALRLGLATIAGEPVAAQFWTVENGTAFIHKLAHVESAAPHSPGTLLSAALFERVIDGDGVDLIDFGTGDDPYKRDWMEDLRPLYRVTAVHPRALRRWPALARLMARRLLRYDPRAEPGLAAPSALD